MVVLCKFEKVTEHPALKSARTENIVDILFSIHLERTWKSDTAISDNTALFSEDELLRTADSLQARGPYKIPTEVLNAVFK